MASEPKTGNVLGYDPSCLLCNLRSDPYCLKCVKSRERKTGNACAGHRTPCGVVKHPDIRTEREDVNPPAPSESVKQEPAPLPQDQDYPEPGSFEDEPRVAEPVLQETTLQLGTTQIGDGGSKAGQTEAQERLRQEFLPSTNGVAPEPPATVPRTAEPEPQVLNDSQLDNALRALRLGFKVFPCHPRSKKPAGEAAPNGVKDATADEAQIRRW